MTGYELTCSWCGKGDTKVEGGVKLCSRCRGSGYCSSTCQKLDWKKHRLACAACKTSADRAESLGLSKPHLTMMQDDLHQWLRGDIDRKISWLALRSALRLGRSNSLALTHYLYLELEYNERASPLRARFELRKGEVRSFAATFSDPALNNGDEEFCANLRSQMANEAGRFSAGGEEGEVLFGVSLIKVYTKTKMAYYNLVGRRWIIKSHYYIPIEEIPLNEDWLATLRDSFAEVHPLDYPHSQTDHAAVVGEKEVHRLGRERLLRMCGISLRSAQA